VFLRAFGRRHALGFFVTRLFADAWWYVSFQSKNDVVDVRVDITFDDHNE